MIIDQVVIKANRDQAQLLLALIQKWQEEVGADADDQSLTLDMMEIDNQIQCQLDN